ncbi:hypothetical protein [Nocardioides sp. SYSU D00065]|uniref:hypothetical protein n=1 Tax=Nocardioides sp. SYSU D00065 TaxID=2817378 RepID=UPI001B335412|nr:hypothetical protein [Nocardioides sp. SYSU D00065]
MRETIEATRVDWPDVPTSAWALGYSFVVGQSLALFERGTQPPEDWLISIALSVALVVLGAHGVMRARMIRFWLVVAVVIIAAVGGVVSLFVAPSAWDVLELGLTVVQLILLRTYYRSEWFALHRQNVPGAPSLAPIMFVAVLVGVMGGMLGAGSNGVSVTFNVGS